MTDATADEDASPSNLHSLTNNEDNDPSDEQQDFRFLAALTAGSNGKHQIPKRGEKDFEPHGTKHQDTILEASRQAMHDALDYTRIHAPKSYCRGWYFGGGVLDGREEVEEAMSDAARGRGLDKDHVVMVESSRGTHYRTMGKTALGKADARIWLLPEEALYLVERGNLDLWWPASPLAAVKGQVRQYGIEEAEGDDEEEADDGLPLSLQAAYALLIGDDGEKGKVSLDRYTVYANLKRTGYAVFRDHNQDPSSLSQNTFEPQNTSNLFTWLFGALFTEKPHEHAPYGPLVQPGLYRSYNQIYRQLFILPRHAPSPQLTDSSIPAQYPLQLAYNIWKPTRILGFAKSNPGTPDFRIAVVSSRSTTVPSLTELISLLDSTPWDPPLTEWTGPEKSYHRIKHGWRNVILAVVDQGVISYLRVSESAFGEEKLYDRFDSGSMRGGKRGGGRGRGRGRGRGHGKSGGGRGRGRGR